MFYLYSHFSPENYDDAVVYAAKRRTLFGTPVYNERRLFEKPIPNIEPEAQPNQNENISDDDIERANEIEGVIEFENANDDETQFDPLNLTGDSSNDQIENVSVDATNNEIQNEFGDNPTNVTVTETVQQESIDEQFSGQLQASSSVKATQQTDYIKANETASSENNGGKGNASVTEQTQVENVIDENLIHQSNQPSSSAQVTQQTDGINVTETAFGANVDAAVNASVTDQTQTESVIGENVIHQSNEPFSSAQIMPQTGHINAIETAFSANEDAAVNASITDQTQLESVIGEKLIHHSNQPSSSAQVTQQIPGVNVTETVFSENEGATGNVSFTDQTQTESVIDESLIHQSNEPCPSAQSAQACIKLEEVPLFVPLRNDTELHELLFAPPQNELIVEETDGMVITRVRGQVYHPFRSTASDMIKRENDVVSGNLPFNETVRF